MKRIILLVIAALVTIPSFSRQEDNRRHSVDEFIDMGFGMFIHWSMDSQLGAVISHSLVGADKAYRDKFFNELPKTFNPKKFDPEEWAVLAKLAGMEYVVFTTKHHSGFCMFDTETTPFNVMNTPFGRDITKEIVDAFRAQGIKIGFYFSPEDFWVLEQQGVPIGRKQMDMHFPVHNERLMAHDKAQLKELLTNYGKIDILFLDGPAEELKEYAWSIQPDIMVTRGQIETPELKTPNKPMPGPWEACYTMGTDWQYKPTNDPQKDGTEIIKMLIEIRAKGGNFLLNVGPKPNGELQIEQEALLREIALWNYVNYESVHKTGTWHITNDGSTWFTASKDKRTVYAFVTEPWKIWTRKEIRIGSLKLTPATKVSVLGYESKLIEYQKEGDAAIRCTQLPDGVLVSAVNGQRLYTDNDWPNPVVLKFENVGYLTD